MTSIDDSVDTDEDDNEEISVKENENLDEKRSMTFTETNDLTPKPRFKVKQTVYARDIETTGILYHAIIRKSQYGPKSKQVNLALYLAEGGKLTDVMDPVTEEENEEETADRDENGWHYFIHHFGWNVKWDRWVEEEHVYEDDAFGSELALQLREAHATIIKKKTKEKAMLAVYKRSKELEREIYGTGNDNPTTAKIPVNEGGEEQGQENPEEVAKPKTRKRGGTKQQTLEDWITHEKLLRSMSLQGNPYSKPQDGAKTRDQDSFIPIPFPLKKILVEEWEVISCGNYHVLPATLTVHHVLHAYFMSKVEMITGGGNPSGAPDSTITASSTLPETQDGEVKDSGTTTKEYYSLDELQSLLEQYPSLTEWYDMMDGLKLLFDQALARQLLYKPEVAQYLVLKNTKEFVNKAHCEVYSSEFLLRLFLTFPFFVEDGLNRNAFTKEQLGPIFYRVGDLVRFLQRDPGRYFSLSYRRRNADEIAMEKKLLKSVEALKEEAESSATESDTKDDVDEYKEEEAVDVTDPTDPGMLLGRTRSSKRIRSQDY